MKQTEQYYWDQAFEAASREGVGLCVQNVNPKPDADGNPRNMFKDDKEQIFKSAKKWGYKLIGSTTGKNVSFIKS